MSEYDHEPVPGLPGKLPAGEEILWQGSPDWFGLAQRAFHVRSFGVYFAILLIVSLANGTAIGIGLTIAGTIFGMGILFGLAWLSARTTIYTITNRRVVMRFGMALPAAINLPFGSIGGANVAYDGQGRGDIPLMLTGKHRLGYLQFWPHARAWKLARPEPMLRSIKDAASVVAILSAELARTHASPTPASSSRHEAAALAQDAGAMPFSTDAAMAA
jgi:hypothetical protein